MISNTFTNVDFIRSTAVILRTCIVLVLTPTELIAKSLRCQERSIAGQGEQDLSRLQLQLARSEQAHAEVM
jgi:hypothetical protein